MNIREQAYNLSTSGSSSVGIFEDISTRALNSVRIGQSAGKINTGLFNIYAGFQAGANATNSSYTTAIGYNAMFASTNSQFSTAIGAFAAANNKSGSENVYVGYKCGENAINGNQSVAVGAYSMNQNVAANGSVSVGYRAAERTLDGGFCVFIGAQAGQDNRNSLFSTMAGYQSGRASRGNENCLFGAYSGYSNINGNGSCLFGYKSGTNTSGDYNCAFGAYCMQYASGSCNVAIGAFANSYGSNSAQSVFVGTNVASTGAASQSVILGTNAGVTAKGSGFVILGYNSGSGFVNGNSNIFIGQGATSTIPDISNGIAIGSIDSLTYTNSISIGTTIKNQNQNSILIGTELFSDMNQSILLGNTLNINSVVYFKDPLLDVYTANVLDDGNTKFGIQSINYCNILVSPPPNITIYPYAQASIYASNIMNSETNNTRVSIASPTYNLLTDVPYILRNGYSIIVGQCFPIQNSNSLNNSITLYTTPFLSNINSSFSGTSRTTLSNVLFNDYLINVYTFSPPHSATVNIRQFNTVSTDAYIYIPKTFAPPVINNGINYSSNITLKSSPLNILRYTCNIVINTSSFKTTYNSNSGLDLTMNRNLYNLNSIITPTITVPTILNNNNIPNIYNISSVNYITVTHIDSNQYIYYTPTNSIYTSNDINTMSNNKIWNYTDTTYSLYANTLLSDLDAAFVKNIRYNSDETVSGGVGLPIGTYSFVTVIRNPDNVSLTSNIIVTSNALYPSINYASNYYSDFNSNYNTFIKGTHNKNIIYLQDSVFLNLYTSFNNIYNIVSTADKVRLTTFKDYLVSYSNLVIANNFINMNSNLQNTYNILVQDVNLNYKITLPKLYAYTLQNYNSYLNFNYSLSIANSIFNLYNVYIASPRLLLTYDDYTSNTIILKTYSNNILTRNSYLELTISDINTISAVNTQIIPFINGTDYVEQSIVINTFPTYGTLTNINNNNINNNNTSPSYIYTPFIESAFATTDTMNFISVLNVTCNVGLGKNCAYGLPSSNIATYNITFNSLNEIYSANSICAPSINTPIILNNQILQSITNYNSSSKNIVISHIGTNQRIYYIPTMTTYSYNNIFTMSNNAIWNNLNYSQNPYLFVSYNDIINNNILLQTSEDYPLTNNDYLEFKINNSSTITTVNIPFSMYNTSPTTSISYPVSSTLTNSALYCVGIDTISYSNQLIGNFWSTLNTTIINNGLNASDVYIYAYSLNNGFLWTPRLVNNILTRFTLDNLRNNTIRYIPFNPDISVLNNDVLKFYISYNNGTISSLYTLSLSPFITRFHRGSLINTGVNSVTTRTIKTPIYSAACSSVFTWNLNSYNIINNTCLYNSNITALWSLSNTPSVIYNQTINTTSYSYPITINTNTLRLMLDQSDSISLTPLLNCISCNVNNIYDCYIYITQNPQYGIIQDIVTGSNIIRCTSTDLYNNRVIYQNFGYLNKTDIFSVGVSSTPYDFNLQNIIVNVQINPLPVVSVNRTEFIYFNNSNSVFRSTITTPRTDLQISASNNYNIHILSSNNISIQSNIYTTAVNYTINSNVIRAGAPYSNMNYSFTVNSSKLINPLAFVVPYNSIFINNHTILLNTHIASNILLPGQNQIQSIIYTIDKTKEKLLNNHTVVIELDICPIYNLMSHQVDIIHNNYFNISFRDTSNNRLLHIDVYRNTIYVYDLFNNTKTIALLPSQKLTNTNWYTIRVINLDPLNNYKTSLIWVDGTNLLKNTTIRSFQNKDLVYVSINVDTFSSQNYINSSNIVIKSLNNTNTILTDCDNTMGASIQLYNYYTTYKFQNLNILLTTYEINNKVVDTTINNISVGNELSINGVDNICIGNTFTTSGTNSIIIGNNIGSVTFGNIYESIIIGNNSFQNSSLQNMICIGRHNLNDLALNNTSLDVANFISQYPVIIGNNITSSMIDFVINIDNVFLKSILNKIYIGFNNQPVYIGYTSNDYMNTINGDTTTKLLNVNGNIECIDLNTNYIHSSTIITDTLNSTNISSPLVYTSNVYSSNIYTSYIVTSSITTDNININNTLKLVDVYSSNLSAGSYYTNLYKTGSSNVSLWNLLPTTFNQSWQDVCWVNNIFVAVGNNSLIGRSIDGVTWTLTVAPLVNCSSITYSPSLMLYVAVGINGIMTSSDALTWTIEQIPPGTYWLSITWSSSRNLFVVVGNNTTPNALYSSNGKIWNTTTIPNNGANTVIWIPEKNKFMATGSHAYIPAWGPIGTNMSYAYSTDGITWVSYRLPGDFPTAVNSSAYSSTLNIYVTVGWGSLGYSYNGDAWRFVNNPASGTGGGTRFGKVLWVNELGLFIATGYYSDSYNPTSFIITSSDGINWYSQTNILSSGSFNSFNGLVYSPSLKICVICANVYGTGSTFLIYKPFSPTIPFINIKDTSIGIGTTTPNYPIDIQAKNSSNISINCIGTINASSITTPNIIVDTLTISNRVNINNTLSLSNVICDNLVSGSYKPYAYVNNSSNESLWTTTRSFTISWTDVCWGDNIFVAVSPTAYVGTSVDGENWNLIDVPLTNCSSITYSTELYLYVACGTNGLMTSSDALVWTVQTLPSTAFVTSISWSPVVRRFVAVGNNISPNNVLYSSDGINWNTSTIPDNGAKRIRWLRTINKFMVVGSPLDIPQWGIINNMRTGFSSDGINWITSLEGPVGIEDCAYSSSLGIYVVVGNGALSFSYDGFNWLGASNPTSRSGGATRIGNVIWVDEIGLFIASGYYSDSFEPTSYIITSSDGINWVMQTNFRSNAAYYGFGGLTYSPKLRICVIAGRIYGIGNIFLLFKPYSVSYPLLNIAYGLIGNGTTTPRYPIDIQYIPSTSNNIGINCVGTINTSNIITSSITLDTINSSTTLNLNNVSLGSYRRNAYITESSNTSLWTLLPSLLDTYRWTGICIAANDIFVAVSTGNTVGISTNGTDWRKIPSPNIGANSVCYSYTCNLAVAVGSSGIMTSTNYLIWTKQSLYTNTPNLNSVCWSPSSNLFVAVSSTATSNVYYSSNGTNWQNAYVDLVGGVGNVQWIPKKQQFMAINYYGIMYYSSNALTWNNVSIPSNAYSFAYSSTLNMYVISGNTYVSYSFDRINWSNGNLGNISYAEGYYVTWLPVINVFIITGNTDTCTSADGINWYKQSISGAINGNTGRTVYSPSANVYVTTLNNTFSVLKPFISTPILNVANGNIGIGTVNPIYPFDIQYTDANNISLNCSGSILAQNINAPLSTLGNNSNNLRIQPGYLVSSSGKIDTDGNVIVIKAGILGNVDTNVMGVSSGYNSLGQTHINISGNCKVWCDTRIFCGQYLMASSNNMGFASSNSSQVKTNYVCGKSLVNWDPSNISASPNIKTMTYNNTVCGYINCIINP